MSEKEEVQNENNLFHVKMRSGEDIVTYLSVKTENENTVYVFTNPVKLLYDIEAGYIGMNWLNLSEGGSTYVYPDDITFVNKSSSFGIDLYKSFIEHTSGKSNESNTTVH